MENIVARNSNPFETLPLLVLTDKPVRITCTKAEKTKHTQNMSKSPTFTKQQLYLLVQIGKQESYDSNYLHYQLFDSTVDHYS